MLHESHDMPQRKKPGLEWITLGMLTLCYALWAGAGWLLYPAAPLSALAIMAVAVALHSSLQHEMMHGHPTRSGLINEILVGLPVGLAYPYRRYKTMHMQHHNDERLTDPYDDPESYYRAEGDWQTMSPVLKQLLVWNNTLIGRILLGPGLGIFGFFRADLKKIRTEPAIRKAWIIHAFSLVPLVLIVHFGFGIPLWLYMIGPAYFGLSLIGVRTYCEHQWFENPDGRTIIVEKSILSVLFLYNNLHIVHHKLPTVAWYQLPGLYRARKAEWQAINGGYVYRNYWEIFRRHAFRAKEPNVHPALRREKQTEQAAHEKVAA